MKGLLLAAGGLCAGLLAGFVIWGRDAGTASPPPSATADRSSLPRPTQPATTPAPAASAAAASVPSSGDADQPQQRGEDLAREISRRVALEAELAELKRRLPAEPSAAELESTGAPGAAAEERPPREGQVDEEALLSAGFDRGEVADIRERLGALELERLFIRDQAGREGWLREPRFFNEMVRLGMEQAKLRDEYGDDGYDWILYASGRENRVVAGAVIPGSPAEQIGLEAGDVILAYANQRILAPHELQRATLSNELGGSVALDVERNGEPIRFYIPVGPIGIQLETRRQAPLHPR